MGDRDFVEPLLEKLRTVHLGQPSASYAPSFRSFSSLLSVHMKPGKPLTFATIETPSDKTDSAAQPHRTIVFGLPGNPVQAHISSALRLDFDRPEYHGASLRWEPNVPAALASSAASLPSSAGSTAAALPLAPLFQAVQSFLRAAAVVTTVVVPDDPDKVAVQADHALLHMVAENRGSTLILNLPANPTWFQSAWLPSCRIYRMA
ncbi:unnamed protein product [Closterium sp. NIES-65]|nr:unnamed protein product [Closterium sp. NIES-65]